MKFTLIAVAAAIFGLHPNNGVTGSSIIDHHVKSMTATRLFPGAHYGIEVDASEKSWSEIVNTRADRSFGRVWLEKRFIREMQEFGGVSSSPDLSRSSGDALTKMRMTHIVKTSEWHTDGIVGGGRLSAAQGFYVLNDNPDAYFETDDDELCIPFVKGSFITFNGRKPHRTVINDGSVDLLGPFDLPSLKCVLADYLRPDRLWKSIFGKADFGRPYRRELDVEDATATSSITGSVVIAGYPNGIDPITGEVNVTLWVRYDLQGCNGTCTVLEVEDDLNFCDQVAIGDLDPDNSEGDLNVVENVNPTANDTETTDVDTAINQLFGRPMVVQDANGRVLACAMFKEITNNTNSDASASAEEIPVNDKTQSGAMGSASSAAWVFFVATTVVVAAVSF